MPTIQNSNSEEEEEPLVLLLGFSVEDSMEVVEEGTQLDRCVGKKKKSSKEN